MTSLKWVKDVRLDWPTVMFDDFLHQLVSGTFLRGSMLESTGSHGRGVKRRVPQMRRMVEFNCTSTRAERDQTRAQYSAAK